MSSDNLGPVHDALDKKSRALDLEFGGNLPGARRSVRYGEYNTRLYIGITEWKLRGAFCFVWHYACRTKEGTTTDTRTIVLAVRLFKKRGKRRDDGEAHGRPRPSGPTRPHGASAAAACDCSCARCGCGGLDAARYPAYPASSRENDVDALAEGHDPQRVRGPVPLEQRAV